MLPKGLSKMGDFRRFVENTGTPNVLNSSMAVPKAFNGFSLPKVEVSRGLLSKGIPK